MRMRRVFAADLRDGHRRAAADRASSSLSADGQRVERARVADLAERVIDAPPHVGTLVFRGGDQRVDRLAIADLTERGRRRGRGW